MCLAQGHNAVTPVSLKPAAPRSQVKHSTTEALRSHMGPDITKCVVCGSRDKKILPARRDD